MERIIKRLWKLAFLLVFLMSCEKDQNTSISGERIDIYLLESFETVPGNDMINDSTCVLSKIPLIPFSEIISYNMTDHSFEITPAAADSLYQDGGLRYHFKAFAITVNHKIVYTGYFWPAYSSSIKQWFVIDPIFYTGENKLFVQKAYPSDAYSGNYKDMRNDKKIIDVCLKSGKLRF